MLGLLLQAAYAAPVSADSLDEIVLEVRSKHQAPFLIGGTWDTMKTLEKLLADTGVPADLRRVADDLSLASTALTEAVGSGAYQCAIYLGKSANGMYSYHRFGDCDNPPAASLAPPVSAKGALTPDADRTAPMFVAGVSGAPEGMDAGAARTRLQGALASRKWPTGDPARYAAAAAVRELTCSGEKPSCRAAMAWTVTDTERKAVVYQVVTRGQGSGATAGDAGFAALESALVSLLSRPLLVSRLDPTPPVGGDPAPDWSGEVAVRACPVPGPPLPDQEADLRSRVGTATRDDRSAPAILLSPDGWALVPAALADRPTTVTVGQKSGEAIVIRTDRSMGLALVKLPGDDWPCLPMGTTPPSAGAKVFGPLPDKLAPASVLGVQVAGSFKFLKTNLPAPPTGLPLLDATGAVRAVSSTVVSLGGMAGSPFGLPSSTLLDRLDIALGTASETDPTSRAGARGTAAVVPTVDADDPAP